MKTKTQNLNTQQSLSQLVKIFGNTALPKVSTAAEAITAAKLNWEVQQHPTFYRNAAGKYISMDTCPRFALANVRSKDGRPLAAVGPRYTPINNKDVFSFFDEVVKLKDAKYTHAGELHGGRMVYLQATLPKNLLIFKGDEIEKRITFITGHDGSFPLVAFFTPTRLVCTNQLNRVKRQIAIRHTANHANKSKVTEAQRIFGLSLAFFEEFGEQAKAMAKVRLDDKTRLEYFKDVLGLAEKESAQKEDTLERLVKLHDSGRGTAIPGVRGTLWGAYNAVTEFADHETEVRSEQDDPTARLRSSWMGGSSRLKEKAIESALELVVVRN